MRLLVVEDEFEIAGLLVDQLQDAGFECDCAETAGEAYRMLTTSFYNLVLLDRRLPDGDGVSHIPSFRKASPKSRIILLTARDSANDKAQGLDAGADDYLAKPYEPEELLARIRARLRNSPDSALPPIKVGVLTYDQVTGQIFVRGRLVVLHRREFSLLESLMRRVNQVAVRQSLAQDIWGRDEAVLPGALDTLVSRLRRRLGDEGAEIAIHLIRGRGYLLTEAEACKDSHL
jgi:two-component system, OmpR family, response regulator